MLLQADAYNIPLPDRSVHCVVTSPPYWGLRKYSGEQQRGEYPDLGLEKTPEEHIERMVSIFREIKRVLRDDGVVWLNYGDCYASGQVVRRDTVIGGGDIPAQEKWQSLGPPQSINFNTSLQQGNLMLMPHRVAIALQDDWIVRNDLIWYKRNPMPESVAGWRWEKSRKEISREIMGGKQPTNRGSMTSPEMTGGVDKVEYEYGDDYVLRKGSWRHTRAHEYIFQLVKKMNYYSNQEAVREEGVYSEKDLRQQIMAHRKRAEEKRIRSDGGQRQVADFGRIALESNISVRSGRNPRSVLDVPTAPYKGAHYATFPPNLIAPLIRASCPRRSCPECGQAWAPVVEKTSELEPGRKTRGLGPKTSGIQDLSATKLHEVQDIKILDYRPTCSHNHDPIPGIVLDPFIGSGTTGAVARELQRRWIGLDISMDYIDQQAKVRALKWTPSNALDNLPLFEGLE